MLKKLKENFQYVARMLTEVCINLENMKSNLKCTSCLENFYCSKFLIYVLTCIASETYPRLTSQETMYVIEKKKEFSYLRTFIFK